MIEFQPWPKIARLNRDITVTEKIDGTNAAVLIERLPHGVSFDPGADPIEFVAFGDATYAVAAQSRKRLIYPDSDNFGFAAWILENAIGLATTLGEGRHFGEWWGSGIQRGYGLEKGEKRFSLFNTARYGELDLSAVRGLSVVPVLYEGPFSEHEIVRSLTDLDIEGSRAAPGFMDPEGVVVFHQAAQQMFKVTIKGDEAPKGLADRA